MTTSLITSAQVVDNADRITYMPKMQAVVKGLYNQVFLSDVASKDDAIARLRDMGYVVTAEWLPGLYGAESTYIHRAA